MDKTQYIPVHAPVPGGVYSSVEKKPFVVAVEGPIGAGKTTYIEMISKQLTKEGWNVTVVKEPVDKWIQCGILDLFYKDPIRWGYHFQTKAFHDRVTENILAYEKYIPLAGGRFSMDVFILERSPFSDRIFMELLYEQGTITKLEWDHHIEWWNMWMRLMPYTINLFVYLQPGIDVCMIRLKERSRDEEVGVKRDYQLKLIERHDKIFNNEFVILSETLSVPCVKLTTTVNYRDDVSVQVVLAKHFESTINSFTQKAK